VRTSALSSPWRNTPLPQASDLCTTSSRLGSWSSFHPFFQIAWLWYPFLPSPKILAIESSLLEWVHSKATLSSGLSHHPPQILSPAENSLPGWG
jgi:hypothetical protein